MRSINCNLYFITWPIIMVKWIPHHVPLMDYFCMQTPVYTLRIIFAWLTEGKMHVETGVISNYPPPAWSLYSSISPFSTDITYLISLFENCFGRLKYAVAIIGFGFSWHWQVGNTTMKHNVVILRCIIWSASKSVQNRPDIDRPWLTCWLSHALRMFHALKIKL